MGKHCSWFNIVDLFCNTALSSTHHTCPVIALTMQLLKDRFSLVKRSLITLVRVDASMEGTLYKPRNSLCTCRSSVTWRMTRVTCSLLEAPVVSSAITVRKGDLWSSAVIVHSSCMPIVFTISFCMSGLVYTFSFLFNRSARFGLSAAFM